MNESRSLIRNSARSSDRLWLACRINTRNISTCRKEDGRRGSGRPAAQPSPDPAGKAQNPPNHSAARACRPSPKAPSDAPQYRRTRPDPASHAPVRDQLHGIMIPRSAPGGFWRCPAVKIITYRVKAIAMGEVGYHIVEQLLLGFHAVGFPRHKPQAVNQSVVQLRAPRYAVDII